MIGFSDKKIVGMYINGKEIMLAYIKDILIYDEKTPDTYLQKFNVPSNSTSFEIIREER